MPRTPRATMPLPILVTPRFDAKPWGSRRLGALCGELPDGLIGEALLTAPDARARSGPEAGRTLGELAAAAPHHWCGEQGLRATQGQAIFPLLAKIIDATATLSVQVHPDDALAAARGLGTGKTEAWHILDAAPGSVLYAGLREGVEAETFLAACRGDDDVSPLLTSLPARPGMTVVIPAGTVHAIGGGLLLYEIQQPSNVTFRLNDWGRRDEAGAPRELHHADGLAALHAQSSPQPAPPLRLTPERLALAATPWFALEQVLVPGGKALLLPPVASPQVLTVLHGEIEVAARGVHGSIVAGAGQTLVAPALAALSLVPATRATVLRGWAPDLETDVLEPARAAGADARDIARLGPALAAATS
ncbi:MAG: class I mannose-6-phosphate isomerase [Thermomicrobiales bacterium]